MQLTKIVVINVGVINSNIRAFNYKLKFHRCISGILTKLIMILRERIGFFVERLLLGFLASPLMKAFLLLQAYLEGSSLKIMLLEITLV